MPIFTARFSAFVLLRGAAAAMVCVTPGFLARASAAVDDEPSPYPLGALQAKGEVADADSLRLSAVKRGGPLDDAGPRARDELLAVQVGGKMVGFKMSKASGNGNPFGDSLGHGLGMECLHVLGEALDLAEGSNGKMVFAARLGRDATQIKVEVPVMGRFIPGQVIGAAGGKPTKNDLFFNGCCDWMVRKQKDGKGFAFTAPLAWEGLALLCSPNPDHQAHAAKIAAFFEAVLAKDQRIRTGKAFVRGNCNHVADQNVIYAWAVLFLSEYNWRHPDTQRRALLEKACNELAESLFNPSYKYKEPSWEKEKNANVPDAENPDKKYFPGRLVYDSKPARPLSGDPGVEFPARELGPALWARSLGVSMWAWSSCAATSEVRLKPAAAKVAEQYAHDFIGYKGAVSPETAGYWGHALLASNKSAAAAWSRQAEQASLRSGQTEFSNITLSSLLVRGQGAGAYKARFADWRWYLALMMQPDNHAEFLLLHRSHADDFIPGDTEAHANAMAAFLLAAPSRRLWMLGAAKPPKELGNSLGTGANK